MLVLRLVHRGVAYLQRMELDVLVGMVEILSYHHIDDLFGGSSGPARTRRDDLTVEIIE